MFKDVFVLKKTSWHVRMMKYIWGLDYKDFTHMCPYWWLSVFNFVIAIWVVGFFKEGYKILKYTFAIISQIIKEIWIVISPPFKWVASRVSEIIDILEEKARRIAEEKRIKEEQLLKIQIQEKNNKIQKLIEEFKEKDLQKIIIEKKGKFNEVESQALRQIHGWFNFDDYLADYKRYNMSKNHNDDYITEWGQKIEEPMNPARDYDKEEMIRRKQFINKVNNIVRPLMKIIGYTVGTFIVSFLLYGLWLALPYIGKFFIVVGEGIWWLFKWIGNVVVSIPGGVKWLYKGSTTFVSSNSTFLLWFLLLIVLIVFFTSFIIFLGRYNYQKRFYNRPNSHLTFDNIVSKLNKFFKLSFILFKPFIFIWKLVSSFFKMLFKQIKNFFLFLKKCIYFIIQMLKNQCPAIEWQD